MIPGATVHYPAWLYLYERKPHPPRGAVAWHLLRLAYGEEPVPRSRAVNYLSAYLGITDKSVREMLRKGSPVFWQQDERLLKISSWGDMWERIAKESPVDRTETITIQRSELYGRQLHNLRSLLAQPALSRGSNKPTSLAYSAAQLGCSQDSARRYRQNLQRQGKADIMRMWNYLRRDNGEPLAVGEFRQGGWIKRELPSLVVLLTDQALPISFEHNREARIRKLQPRRYFHDTEELEKWQRRGLPTSVAATIWSERKRNQEWETANVFAGGLERSSSNEEFYLSQLESSKIELVTPCENVRSGSPGSTALPKLVATKGYPLGPPRGMMNLPRKYPLSGAAEPVAVHPAPPRRVQRLSAQPSELI